MAYKFRCPHDWLKNHVSGLCDLPKEDAVTALCNVVDALAGRLDDDSLQDLFQGDMDADGYFEPADEVA